MRAKFQMDPEKLKALCGQGLTNGEIGQQFGCSSALIRKRRRELGISASLRGPHSGTKRGSLRGGNGARAATRAAIASAGGNFKPRRKADAAGTVTVHLSAAALDRLWEDLSLETKADLIEQILGN